jgi:hypothetical protein
MCGLNSSFACRILAQVVLHAEHADVMFQFVADRLEDVVLRTPLGGRQIVFRSRRRAAPGSGCIKTRTRSFRTGGDDTAKRRSTDVAAERIRAREASAWIPATFPGRISRKVPLDAAIDVPVARIPE